MTLIARTFIPIFLFGVLILPTVAQAADCGIYTCTSSQICKSDVDGNEYCATGGTAGGPTGGTTGVVGGPTGSSDGKLINPLGTTDLEALVLKILDFIIKIGAIVVIFMLVYVGFLFVTARGEPAKLTVARQALLWTIVGALILLGSKAISLAIQDTVKAL